MNNDNDDCANLLELLRSVAIQSDKSYLTCECFREATGIPMSRIHRYYDSWAEACSAAGIESGNPGDNIVPNYSKGKDHAISELKRVAEHLNVNSLSKSQFNSCNPEIRASTAAGLCGGWDKALEAAGLERDSRFRDEIPAEDLTREFLAVCGELGQIPTVIQLTRRSDHSKNSFTRKFGSYTAFKRHAMDILLNDDTIDPSILAMLENHRDEISPPTQSESESAIRPHAKGRHLGFRAFAFAPTYEGEVVSLFSAVADELGFEIVAQRPAFPDCEARRLVDRRRNRYEKCLIEFEYRSSDYTKHKHPITGCDLIVCWVHDWSDCPIPVIEMHDAIRSLSGWR